MKESLHVPGKNNANNWKRLQVKFHKLHPLTSIHVPELAMKVPLMN
jgi:hypothetical protein